MKNLDLFFFCIFIVFFLKSLSNTLDAQDSTIFFDDFEGGQFNPQWRLNQNISGSNGSIQIWDGLGINSSRGVAIGKSMDGAMTTNALDLHLNLSGYEGKDVSLSFFILDVEDGTDLLDGIYFSDDNGVNFHKVLDFLPEQWCDQYGLFPQLDVDELAQDNGLVFNNQFVIRFQQQGTADFDILGGRDGFFLDNIHVYKDSIKYAKLPFCDDFETGVLDDKWVWRFADKTSNISNPATKPSGAVKVASGIGHNSEFAVQMGKWCDDGFSANALDLHLDLSGHADKRVELTFFIKDINEETHNDDGLYFSNDGGVEFVKVFDFKPANWCDQYGQFPPFRIDQLAEVLGLSLTNKFVIRFQQYDNEDFYVVGGQDGFYIDYICIDTSSLDYVPIPYREDFESGRFDKEWSWSWADNTVSISTGETRPSNTVHVSQGNGNNSEFAAAMGKWCDDGFTGNALDLHVNLSGKENLVMTYDIKHFNETTHADDGIYFSDNGGKIFKKVKNFDFANMQSHVFHQQQVVNIDQAVIASNLNLTERFVIRFQQFGNEDFWSVGGQDGVILDNINILGDIVNSNTESQIEDELTIYPNPTSSTLNLNFDKIPAAFTTLEISDPWGRLQLDMQLDQGLDTYKIDVSTLATGVYILKLESNRFSVFKKFMKK